MRVPDRRKQRREYLKKKAGAYGKSVWFILPLAFFALITMISINLMIQSLWQLCHGHFAELGNVFAFGLLGWLCSRTTCASYTAINQSIQQGKSTPYVPPVKVGTLSAEEILVRGSQEPTEQSAVLLRSAEERAEVLAEQLLRASTGEREQNTG